MMPQPNCDKRKCRFFRGLKYLDGKSEDTEVVYCDAYPKGIPNDIAYGDDKHLTVREDQNNDITYKQSGK